MSQTALNGQNPLAEENGQHYTNGGSFRPRPVNSKTNLIATGATILARDISANRTSLYTFGDTPNDSVGSFHLAWSAGAAYVAGVYGKAASFAGNNKLQDDAADNAVHQVTTNDFARGVYFALGAVGSAQTIFAKKASGSGAGWRLYVNASNVLVFEVSDGTNTATATGTSALEALKAYYVVVFKAGGAIYIYLNETIEASAVASSVGSLTTTEVFTVGGDSSGATQYLSASSWVDHLEIYSDDLTATQVQTKFRDLHAMQILGVTVTSGALTEDYLYHRNKENTTQYRIIRSQGDVDSYVRFLAQAEVRFADSDSSHYVGFKSPATVATNRIWTLPDADGAAKTFLATDGAGVIAFLNPTKILTDDYAASDSDGTGTAQTLKTYNLGANTYTRILVIAYGKIAIPSTSSGGNNSVTVNIGASAKAVSYSYPDWATGHSGTLSQPWSILYSVAQTGATTVTVTCDPDNTDTPIITCEGFIVIGLNY